MSTIIKKFQLFPKPSVPPSSRISPRPFPGITPDPTETLTALLHDDYQKHHVFYNDRGFQNHLAHHLLASWALGAPKGALKTIYESDSRWQRPAIQSPEPITVNNFEEHLGDERFYQAYLTYFIDQLQQKDPALVFEEHIFSPEFNFGLDGKGGPEMLSRFLDALFHPLIHTGYGFELGLPGMVAEGFAQAAMHTNNSILVPDYLFSAEPYGSDKPTDVNVEGIHALTVLARIINDEKITPLKKYAEVAEKFGERILEYVAEWAQFDASDSKVVEHKIEELQWVNVLLYTIPGFRATIDNKDFNADFFTLHGVTSSLFLGPLISALSSTSQRLLLRTYFSASIALWISRGKPSIDINLFYAAAPAETELKPWSELIQHSITHPDDHFVKCQRALAHFYVLYGTRKPGEDDFSRTELKGADKLDGTVFLRAANLTKGRMDKGRMLSGPEVSTFWDRKGF